MCGFTGIYAFNEIGRFFAINLAKSNETLQHRGPDDAYLFTEERVGLGHRRLAIQDVSTDARQPMTDPSGRYTLVYNGEVYNFKKLRQSLEKKGIAFRSQSDTEVLLHLYIQEGIACLQKLNGFFAFAVYDREENTLFIARDRYGIKPLWYYQDDDKFLFASELNALLAYNLEVEIDYTSMYQFFELNYIPAPHTIYQNVYKLLPGHCMKIRGKEVTTESYYQLPRTELNPPPSYAQACEDFLKVLEQSVQDRLISDVPLGAFLSGGIDSSTIVALAARHVDHLNTFSIGYRDEPFFDETRYAEIVAKQHHTEHTVFKLSNDDFFEHLEAILAHYAEPFADASAIPTFILSKKTKKHVTVALSGDGGDELLAGYQKHTGEWFARNPDWKTTLVQTALPILKQLPQHRQSFLGNKIRQLNRFGALQQLPPQERYWQLCSWRTPGEINDMLASDTLKKISLETAQERRYAWTSHIQGKNFTEVLMSDFQLLLPNDMLFKVDSMSMANSLEVRVPFLDHRVVEYCFQLPAQYKIYGNFKKKLLQDATRNILPKPLYRRQKKGFDIPLTKAYQTVWKSWIFNDLLNDDFIQSQGIFNIEYTQSLKQKIINAQPYDQNQVWGILCFQHWWRSHYATRNT